MMTVRKDENISVSLTNGQHKIISDVNVALGGTDSGLNPHELVEAALGACTTLTLELYAKRKNWDVSDLLVEVKILSEGKDSVIERKITFGKQHSEEEKTRLTEIANKCPIHQLLQSNVKIETAVL